MDMFIPEENFTGVRYSNIWVLPPLSPLMLPYRKPLILTL